VSGPFLPDDEKIPALREALPSTAAGIYLNTGSAGPLPREAAHVMAEAEAWELRTGRADRNYWEEAAQHRAEARATVAAVLGADPARIALTHAATDGMNVACWAIDWRPGDRAVTTSLEHPGTLGPLWVLRERFGVELAVADVGLGGDEAAVLAALDRAIVPGTRLVAVSHVSWATGARLPVREIVELAHGRGALVAIDGAQSAGAMPLAVEELGVDFYAVPGQKWLLGPEGVGALYCAPSALDRPRLTFAGYGSFESMDLAAQGKPWPDARRFETAGYHGPSVLGFARSVAWLSMYVGWPWIYERIARLAGEAAAMLAEVPGVTVLTPAARMAGLVTFRVRGWKAATALKELERRTLCIARTIPPLDAVRISVGFFNTEGELRRFRDGVALVAAHTPRTIPRRPRIEVLRGGVE
jgi:L-cysteine/cystine lyase